MELIEILSEWIENYYYAGGNKEVKEVSLKDAKSLYELIQYHFASQTPEGLLLADDEMREKLIEFYTEKWGKEVAESFIKETNPHLVFTQFILQAQHAKDNAYWQAQIEQAKKEERERICAIVAENTLSMCETDQIIRQICK